LFLSPLLRGRSWEIDPGYQIEQHRFTAAAGSHERKEFSALYLHINALQNVQRFAPPLKILMT
jgi:hypothetical protein